MWVNQLLLGVIGLAAGGAVAAGTFAFLTMLGVVPRMIGKSRTAADVLWYETVLILGGIAGNLYSVFLNLRIPLGQPFLYFFGTCAGIFVGCNALALAEVLKTFPLLFRRLNIKVGLVYFTGALSIGKTLGSIWYFLH